MLPIHCNHLAQEAQPPKQQKQKSKTKIFTHERGVQPEALLVKDKQSKQDDEKGSVIYQLSLIMLFIPQR
jgi:hypothetical protein